MQQRTTGRIRTRVTAFRTEPICVADQRKVTISGRRTSGPCGGCKGPHKGPQRRKGSVTPLRCVNVGP